MKYKLIKFFLLRTSVQVRLRLIKERSERYKRYFGFSLKSEFDHNGNMA